MVQLGCEEAREYGEERTGVAFAFEGELAGRDFAMM